MNCFYSFFKMLLIILTFIIQSAVAEPTLPQKEAPCSAFPENLTYRCVEEKSSTCDPKSLHYKDCCEGLLISSYDEDSCGGAPWPYIPGDSACCKGKPYSNSWEGCCKGKVYLKKYATCCKGRIVPKEACCSNKPIDPKTTGCCEGKRYNYKTQACCEGKIIPSRAIIHIKPTACKDCAKRDPSCFYATIEGSTEIYFAEACTNGTARIVLPKAPCPCQKVTVCMHPRCGKPPVIKGDAQNGYTLEGICRW